MNATKARQDFYRETYEWADGLWYAGGRCERCGGETDTWIDEVPCCGYPFECMDTVYVYACHACQIIGDSF